MLTILQTTTLLALLAAAFTLATAISGRVLASRRQIGLLRAIGLTPAQVTGVLVAHYLVLAGSRRRWTGSAATRPSAPSPTC